MTMDAELYELSGKVGDALKARAPDEAKIYFALARAYAKAGRKADADQARQNFTRLNALAEAAAANGLGRATAIEESEEKPKP